MFHNILVAVDGSPHSDRALTHAIDLAQTEQGRLTLMTAIAELPTTTYLTAGAVVANLIEGARAEGEAILRRAVARVPHDVPVTTVLTAQPIRIAMMRQIKDGHYDLVVMGSRGRGAVRSTLLGSVSHYILHHSSVPVLIVHDDQPRQVLETAAAA